MESSYVRTVCFHNYTKPAWDALRPSFLDVFCNVLGWSQDQAPGMQVPAGNRPLSDPLLPVFLWAGCSRVIGRLHTLLDRVGASAASPLGTVSLDPVHCRPTQTSHKWKEQEARSTILSGLHWSLTRMLPRVHDFWPTEKAHWENHLISAGLSPAIAPLNPFPAMGPGQLLGFWVWELIVTASPSLLFCYIYYLLYI